MIVLALLVTDRQLERVTAAAPAPHTVLSATSVAPARALLRAQPVDVLVLDPAVVNHLLRASAEEFLALGAEHPHLPIVFYISNASVAIRILARFPTHGRCEAVVAGVDDDNLDSARYRIRCERFPGRDTCAATRAGHDGLTAASGSCSTSGLLTTKPLQHGP